MMRKGIGESIGEKIWEVKKEKNENKKQNDSAVGNSNRAVLSVFSGYVACGSNYELRIGNYEL